MPDPVIICTDPHDQFPLIVFDLQILTINSQLPLHRFRFVLLNIKVRDRARSLPLDFPVSGTHLGIDQRHLAGIQNEDDNEQAPQQRQLWTLRRSRLGSRRSHSSVVEVLSVCVCLCFFFLAVIWLYLFGRFRQFYGSYSRRWFSLLRLQRWWGKKKRGYDVYGTARVGLGIRRERERERNEIENLLNLKLSLSRNWSVGTGEIINAHKLYEKCSRSAENNKNKWYETKSQRQNAKQNTKWANKKNKM